MADALSAEDLVSNARARGDSGVRLEGWRRGGRKVGRQDGIGIRRVPRPVQIVRFDDEGETSSSVWMRSLTGSDVDGC